MLSIRITYLVEVSLVYGNGRGHRFIDVRLVFMRMVMFGAMMLRGGCVTAAVGACSSDYVIILAMRLALEICEVAFDVQVSHESWSSLHFSMYSVLRACSHISVGD